VSGEGVVRGIGEETKKKTNQPVGGGLNRLFGVRVERKSWVSCQNKGKKVYCVTTKKKGGEKKQPLMHIMSWTYDFYMKKKRRRKNNREKKGEQTKTKRKEREKRKGKEVGVTPCSSKKEVHNKRRGKGTNLGEGKKLCGTQPTVNERLERENYDQGERKRQPIPTPTYPGEGGTYAGGKRNDGKEGEKNSQKPTHETR